MFDESTKPIGSLLSLSFFLVLLARVSPHKLSSKACVTNSSYTFCNSSLSISSRAEALVSELSLSEKIKQLSNDGATVSRLGIPSYEWWSESLHGLANIGPGVVFNDTIPAATLFPQVILMAASFNKTLWREVGKAIGTEARAMYNEGMAGLTYWAPNVNIFRDPRWGRGQETPGEDPTTTSSYAVEYVKGLQQEDDDGGLMISACCKHFTAYDLEGWGSYSRFTFNAKVTDQDMEDTYQPPFKSCVEDANASCLMCAYNQINGVPACANDILQQARNEWGFDGYITSDCDSVSLIYENQKYASSPEDAVADVLTAGLDIGCGSFLLNHAGSAVEKGKINESDINRALKNLFSVQIRLGLFDSDIKNKSFTSLGPKNVCTNDHIELALEAAKQGIVLLKNENTLLPLNSSDIASLAVIGPVGNDTNILAGDYAGIPCSSISFVTGMKSYVSNITYISGCENVACTSNDSFSDAIEAASEADYVVLILGLDLSQEDEGLDRTSLLLPGKQEELVNKTAEVTKMPLVLVLTGGGPIDVSFAKNNSNIGAIIWVGYPGEAGGRALAQVIFGDYNPGVKLPITWYPESFTDVSMGDMNMRANTSTGYPGRTYRFYTGDTVYEFGYGLSYSNLSHKITRAPQKVGLSRPNSIRQKPDRFKRNGLDHVRVGDSSSSSSCDALKFSIVVGVHNHGIMDANHAVLLFVKPQLNSIGYPIKQLVGFERVEISAGDSTEIEIFVDPCKHMSVVDQQGERVLLVGTHVFMLEDIEHEVYIEV